MGGAAPAGAQLAPRTHVVIRKHGATVPDAPGGYPCDAETFSPYTTTRACTGPPPLGPLVKLANIGNGVPNPPGPSAAGMGQTSPDVFHVATIAGEQVVAKLPVAGQVIGIGETALKQLPVGEDVKDAIRNPLFAQVKLVASVAPVVAGAVIDAGNFLTGGLFGSSGPPPEPVRRQQANAAASVRFLNSVVSQAIGPPPLLTDADDPVQLAALQAWTAQSEQAIRAADLSFLTTQAMVRTTPLSRTVVEP